LTDDTTLCYLAHIFGWPCCYIPGGLVMISLLACLASSFCGACCCCCCACRCTCCCCCDTGGSGWA